LSATEVFGAADLRPGDRRFADGTVVRDVDALQIGFVTNGEIEERRTNAKADNNLATLTRLAEIINAPDCIISRHRRLRKRDGTNRPPFYYLRNLIRTFGEQPRLEADLRVHWWISADRRASYLALTYLEEHGTVENLIALMNAGTVAPRTLQRFRRTCGRSLREEVILRIQRAYTMKATGEIGLGATDGDPVHDLASAVRNPDEWCRPLVHTLIINAAAEGPGGALGVLFPRVLDRRTLQMMHDLNFVSTSFYNALLGIVEDDKEGEDAACKVDTGELEQVLTDGARHAARVGAGAG